MPVYVYQCEKCNEVFQDLHKWGELPNPCPDCGEKEELKKIPTKPQSPKVQGDDRTKNWGYNKTTTEYWFDGAGRRSAEQYDANKREAQVKEWWKKGQSKGATVSLAKKSKKSLDK